MLWKINRLFISLCMFKLTCGCVSEKDKERDGGGVREGGREREAWRAYVIPLGCLSFVFCVFFHQQVIN